MNDSLRVIIGLGITGFSVARYFTARGISFMMMDTKTHPDRLGEFQSLYPKVPLHLGSFDEALLYRCEQIVLSPGVPLSTPALQRAQQQGVEIVGDIELFAREVSKPVIAITGSNGKSTVTSLLGEMAKEAGIDVAVGGNLGTAALDLLLEHPHAALFVLELSSFQLETTWSLKPKAATILNICADHCDRYASMAEYIAAKQRIYHQAEVAIYNADDLATKPNDSKPNGNEAANISWIPQTSRGTTLSTTETSSRGLSAGSRDPDNHTNQQEVIAFNVNQPLFPLEHIQLQGQHNRANIAAACALAKAVGISTQAMQAALEQFSGLPHRCQFVGEYGGVKWINDSKGTNVGATLAAIEGLGSPAKGNLVLIAGGDGKGADFTPLQSRASYLRAVILLGKDAAQLESIFSSQLPCYRVVDLEQAVQVAAKQAQSGDMVLLSPACASIDMFRNYAHRGELFSQLALQWIAQHAKETL